MRHAGKLVTRQRPLMDVWGSEHVTCTGCLRLYVSRLRKKLAPEPKGPCFLITGSGMITESGMG
ncbi:winged helix-turn-helix domain-containing protein [Nocardiopsis dassonvillei subsp. albirubida]|uniref:Winged helix-turn-helix domain-containing protein n=1 Tax=Nocardiopsis alborubida TaxID=146802 RepID=A0A7X6MHS4_9ACTN|nr:winged helix-turn-helix domain-containing protein [Nocardiopsis alborubida]